MPLHPLAGKPAPPGALIDVAKLEREFLSRRPDPSNPRERVKFGTSGHRGTPLDGSLTAAHILAITQAICDYRRANAIDGPLYMGKDTHALSSLSQDAALEVLAANSVETIVQRDDGFTPTPVVSRAVIVHNRGRSSHLADGIVITPSHNPPEDGGFKYNPPNGGPADTDVTRWIQDRANELLEARNRDVKRVSLTTAQKASTTHEEDLVQPYVDDLNAVVDMDAIRSARVTIGVDPLGGASLPYWQAIADELRLEITIVNPKVDPTFGFMTLDHDGKIRMDCSSPYAMAGLVALKDRFQIAVGNDPDADRHGIVTAFGRVDESQPLSRGRHPVPAGKPAGMANVRRHREDDRQQQHDRPGHPGRWSSPGRGACRIQVVCGAAVRGSRVLWRRRERRRELPAAQWDSVDDRQGRPDSGVARR